MEDSRAEKLEALETLVEFNEKVVKNIGILMKELSGQRLDDTDKFQDSIVNAVNWEIQVVNGTLDVLNEGKERIVKEIFNEKVLALGEAIKEKSDQKLVNAFEELRPELEKLGMAAKEVIG